MENQKPVEQPTPETPKQTKPETPKQSAVEIGKYERFTTLKFLKFDGATLKDEYEKELVNLEKELKTCKGAKPAKTVTASIGLKVYKLVKDIPVPKEISDEIKAAGKESYYFG